MPYFDSHPTVDEFWLTADNMAFFASNIAERHAANLTDDSIIPVTRDGYEQLKNEVGKLQLAEEEMHTITQEEDNKDSEPGEKDQKKRGKAERRTRTSSITNQTS